MHPPTPIRRINFAGLWISAVKGQVEVELKPRTGASLETSHSIAQYMNNRLVEGLDIDGLVTMAAYHGLLSRNPMKVAAKHSANRVVNQILVQHYRVQRTSILSRSSRF